MDLFHIVLLLIAGVVGGTISTVIGGASIITFPVLLATGISPLTAVISNTVALAPGNLLAAIYDRSQLPPLGRPFAGLVAASVLGALIGAILLLLTPERMFELLVPLLLGFATVLFAYSKRISSWLRARSQRRSGPSLHRWSDSVTTILPVSIYGGYFGAGIGVLVLGVLSIGTGGDYRSANVTKNLVICLNSIVVSTYFATQGTVAWPQTLTMMAGTLVGAIIGARIAQVLPNDVARRMVVVVGAALTLVYAWRYWL
jgi:uncharacterized membrane protein YfcA